MCACVCLSGFVRATTPTFMDGLQNYFTVVVLEEKKCHDLKHF